VSSGRALRIAADRLAPLTWRRSWALFAGAALAALGVLAVAAWMITDARRVVWDHAVQSSENLLGALDHDIERNIELYDLSLQSVIDGLRLPDIWKVSAPMRRHVLFDRSSTARDLGAILVLDARGRIILDSESETPPDIDLSDRAYFTVHRDRPDIGLYISPPFKGRLSGKWSIAFSRRVDDAAGRFAGVAVGTMRLTLFQRLFATVDPGPGGVVAILCTDGTMIVRKPFRDSDIGRDLSRSPVFRQFTRQRAGHVESVSLIDGTRRLYVYSQVGRLPFMLSVGVASDAVLSDWRQKATILGIAVLGLAALAAGLGIRLVSELRRRGEAERTALESERRLREKSSILEVTLENMDQGLLLVAADRTVPVCNRRAIELLDLPPELMARQPQFDAILDHQFRSGEFQWTEAEFRAWVKAGGIATEHQIYERRRPNGTVLEIRTVPLADGSAVRTYTDVTQRKLAEADLAAAKLQAERAAADAERAREHAEAANRSKSEFLANMSHELRTPLNAVMGFSEVIRDAIMGPVDARYRNYARDIYNAGRHLLSLINDVLDLSKIEVGRLELHEEVVDVAAIIADCERIIAARAREAGLHVAVDLAADRPMLRADKLRLKQIILNLLSNAVKFTPPGGRVTISARSRANGEFALAVADTGIGMKPEEVPLALEPFRQIDSAFNRRYEGTGLGLPLVQRLAALHGGSLAIDTAPEAGTTVTITLPAKRCIREVA